MGVLRQPSSSLMTVGVGSIGLGSSEGYVAERGVLSADSTGFSAAVAMVARVCRVGVRTLRRVSRSKRLQQADQHRGERKR